MADQTLLTRPLPVTDPEAFAAECVAMIDWIGTIEMPEERVGIREAAGNLGGILVGLMTSGRASFYAGEASDVADLCGHLKDTADGENRGRILEAIFECACQARDGSTDIEVEFQGS